MPDTTLSPEEQKIIAIIFGIIMIIGATIVISRLLFPYFLVCALISCITLVVAFLIEVFGRDHSNLEFTDYFSFYIAIFFVIMVIGMFITYFIGFGLGGTTLGVAILDVYGTVIEVETEISDTLDTAINQVVEENCKILSEENCQILRNTAKSIKSAKELAEFANNLEKVSNIIT